MKRFILAAALALAAFSAAAATPQSGAVTFTLPTTGGAPTGFRLYLNNALAATLTPGQSATVTAPDYGTHVVGVEAFNSAGSAARVNLTSAVAALLPPGPVGNLTVTFACSLTTPATCTVTNVAGP